MIEHMGPGNYWLVTASGGRRKAVLTDDLTLLIHQEAIYSYDSYRGEKWWQPPTIHDSWSFVPRVEE